MKYFKVKPEFDQRARYTMARGGGLNWDSIFIANELYTSAELKRYPGAAQYVEPVEIPKSKIYFCFGARFADMEVTQ